MEYPSAHELASIGLATRVGAEGATAYAIAPSMFGSSTQALAPPTSPSAAAEDVLS